MIHHIPIGVRRRAGSLCFAAAALVLGPRALPAQGNDTLITVNVQDESVANLLQAIAAQHRISFVAGEQAQGKVTINLFDVPLDAALRQILATQGLDFQKQGNFYRILSTEQFRAAELAADAMTTKVFSLNHLTTTEAQQLLQPLLSPEGRLSTTTGAQAAAPGSGGGAGGSSGAATGSGQRQTIVLHDHISVVEALTRTMQEIDRPPPQVLLEATILSIDLGEDNRLGVDLNVLGGIDFNSAGATSDLTGLTGYSATGNQLDNRLFSGQTLGFSGAPPTSGLALGFIKNNVAAFVDALERTTNATIVSNPRVIALNGQEAKIIVGGRLGYTTVTQTQTSTVQTVNFLETGTQLMFRPFVGTDGWIRMEVHPQNSAGVIDPVSGRPSESTTEITTRILMRDGQTLILGGLIGESITTARDQIPLLGSLPLIGWLFARTQESVTRRELVILLTPHILDPVQAQSRADEAKQRLASVRASHWDSLSPYLRPVVSRRLLADARVLQAGGELERALGACERAVRMNPTEVDAAVLRDQLLEQIAMASLPVDELGQALLLLKSMPAAAPQGAR